MGLLEAGFSLITGRLRVAGDPWGTELQGLQGERMLLQRADLTGAEAVGRHAPARQPWVGKWAMQLPPSSHLQFQVFRLNIDDFTLTLTHGQYGDRT